MEGLIASVILYACFYLYGYILDIQQIRRRRGKRALNWFELLIRSPWWAAKILIRMLPAILIWFFGLILFNWLLGFAYSSIDAAFLGSGWKMSFVNFPPRSWGGLILGLWALLCWLALLFTRLGTKSAGVGFDCAYRSIYRGIEQMVHHAFIGFQVGSKWQTIAWANIWNQNDPTPFVQHIPVLCVLCKSCLPL